MRVLVFFLFMIAFALWAADPVPSDRLISGGTWETAVGVVGGIPTNRTTMYTNFTSSATAAQINGGIASCPSNQYVHCAAGTYAFTTGTILLNKNGVSLRGDVDANGAATTIFKNIRIFLGNNSGWDFGSSSGWTTTTISSGATRGSVTMTFASVSGLSVGRLVWVHASSNTDVTGSNWSDVFGIYPVSQVMKVIGISGNNVTFELPFSADYWTGTIRAAWMTAGDQTRLAGIENISMTPTDSSAGFGDNYIEVRGADECWIKNVRTYDLAGQNTHHVWVYGSYRLEVRHCDMSRMRAAEGAGDSSNNYCVLLSHSGAWCIEDNYFHQVPNVMPLFDSGEGAFAYNYINDLPYGNSSPGWQSQIVFNHGSHMHYNLFEGNWCAGSYNEQGTSGSRNTIWFRNRMLGWDANPTQGTPKNADTVAIVIADGHFRMVLAGNVMGTTGYHTNYQTADTVAGGGSDTFPDHSVIHVHNTALSTLIKTNNYNTVNAAVPAGEALTGQTMLNSYLHSSKPSFFGDRPWPFVDPANYPQSNAATNLPAGFRATFGFDPPATAGGPGTGVMAQSVGFGQAVSFGKGGP